MLQHDGRRLPASNTAREEGYSTTHVPDYSSIYIVLPSLLLAVGVGLISVAIYTIEKYGGKDLSYGHILPLGLVTLSFQIYHLIAEKHQSAYNYYAILIPDGILCLWFLVTWAMHAVDLHGWMNNSHHEFEDDINVCVLVLCLVGWIISVVSVILFGIAVGKHRSHGGKCTPGRSKSRGHRAQENGTYDDTGSGTASENVNTDASRNTSDNVNGATTGDESTSDRVNVDRVDGNRDTSNKCSASKNRLSVHYVPGHPYHPLRLNPVDSMGATRSVMPDVAQRENETIGMGKASSE